MSRAEGVANGTAAAVERPVPRTPGLRRRMQDGDATLPAFSEQLDTLAATVLLPATRADPVAAGSHEDAQAGQNRRHTQEALDAVEPRLRAALASRTLSLPFDGYKARKDRIGTTDRAADDGAAAPHRLEAEPLQRAAVPQLVVGETTAERPLAPESTVRVSSRRTEGPLGADVRSLTDTPATASRNGRPDRDAAGRADETTSGVKLRQTIPASDGSPRRQPPTSTLATASTVASKAVDRQSARAGDVPVSIVRQETHAPPATRLSPAAQIASAVADDLQRINDARGVRTPIGAPPEVPATVRVVRVLQVRLEPPELGTVSIRMRLDANALEVRIDARQPGTADLIRGDHGVLTRLLQSAGYDVEALTVHLAEPDRSIAPGNSSAHQSPQSSPNQGAFQAHSGSSHPDGRSGGAQQHAGRQNEAAATGAAETGSESPGAGVPGGDGIYV